jgi:predicted aspartyl protease
MIYHFNKTKDEGLIVVTIEIDNKFGLNVLLDTGASHTTIDSNDLYMNGYDLKDKIKKSREYLSLISLIPSLKH